MYNLKIGKTFFSTTPGTNDKNRTPPQKKKQTNSSLSNLSSQSTNQSDTPSNKVVMEEKNNTKNVPIAIPTIQKSVLKSAGTTSTKNNMTGGNEKEKSSSSGKISTTDKKLFIDLIDLDEKNNTKPNIGLGTDTTTNMTNFDHIPAEQKKKNITTW